MAGQVVGELTSKIWPGYCKKFWFEYSGCAKGNLEANRCPAPTGILADPVGEQTVNSRALSDNLSEGRQVIPQVGQRLGNDRAKRGLSDGS
jgi:hypothetical protein